MKAIWQFWVSHGTKILGFLAGSVGVIAGTSRLIPDTQLPWWMLASGLLTFYRGFFNTKQNEGQS